MNDFRKTVVLLLAVLSIQPWAAYAQNTDDQFVLPKDAQLIRFASDGSRQLFATHPDGTLYVAAANTVVGYDSNRKYTLPSRINPSSMVFTNGGDLILFAGDTIYKVDTLSRLKPLLTVKAKRLIIQPIGLDDFAYCIKGNTVIRRWSEETDKAETVVSFSDPVWDFVVDGEDYFVANGNRVTAYTGDKKYVPIFIDDLPILNLSFCTGSTLLYSNYAGLWCIDTRRQKKHLYDKPVIDIITDYYDRAFIELLDGSWIAMRGVSQYDRLDTSSTDNAGSEVWDEVATLSCDTVVSHNDLNMRYERLVALPTMGPYVIDGNKMVSLLSDNGSTITFPDGLPLDDLVWMEKDFIVKAYNALYWLGDMSKPIRAFDDTTFLVFPRDTNSLYLVLRHDENDMSSVFLFNIKLKAMKRLVSVPGWVVTLSGSKNATMIVTEQSAWLFTEKECVTYMNFWEPLRDAVMTDKGLVCADDGYLFLLTAPFHYKILAKGSFNKLLYDMKDLYIVTGEGDLLRVERW